MTYYTLLIYVSLLIFDLLILNLVWRALKGPNRLTELSAAVVSFAFIAIAVVVTFTALTTTVEAAKLTKAIPGDNYKAYAVYPRYSTMRPKYHRSKHGRRFHTSKHGYGTNRPVRKPMRKNR